MSSGEPTRLEDDLIREALRALNDVQFEPSYGPVPDPIDCLAALDRLVAREARVRAVVEKWEANPYEDWGGNAVRACAVELEAALSDPEVK